MPNNPAGEQDNSIQRGAGSAFAVQIAKSPGAEVTAVCSTPERRPRAVNRCRSCPRLHERRFHEAQQRYDVIFDNVCNHSYAALRRVLTPKGICVLAGVGGAGIKGVEAISCIVGTFTPAALRQLDGGHARGKLVVTMQPQPALSVR